MATNYGDLRETAIKSRQESSQAWLARYSRARDELFQEVVEGASAKMQAAAESGNFRVRVWEYTRTRRGEEPAEGETQQRLRFGQCSEDENGLHVETLLRPRGVPFRESLMGRLREHFNPSTEGEDSAEGRRFSVYFSRHPQNRNQGAIFVSWERTSGRSQTGQRSARTFSTRSRGRGGRRFQGRRQQGEQQSAPQSS